MMSQQSTGKLPPSIISKIRDYDRASEIMMRSIQLAIVLTFAALYFASPKSADTGFSLVPAALSIYSSLTIVGLLWSLRHEVPDWAAYVSIALDIGLLMTLIWSFHLQYEQPLAFYLKVPTFIYIFIFIALRALRFDAKFVLAAGLASIISWAFMVTLVIVSDGASSIVTRDYVGYLTSNTLLVGAEIDKLIAVGMVTSILYVVLRRGRALLVQAVSEETAATNLARFFDEPVASRIRATDDLASQGARREAAILFVDIRGFTQLAARMEPAEVIQMLAEYQRRVVPLIHTHGGVIDKFMGDGIMATFGAVTESATYAADALRAVDAILLDADGWSSSGVLLGRMMPRSLGAGVAAGTVICGTVGDGTRLDFTVIGSPVNLAAKLEKLNSSLGSRALTAAATLSLAVEQGYSPPQDVTVVHRGVGGLSGTEALAVLHT